MAPGTIFFAVLVGFQGDKPRSKSSHRPDTGAPVRGAARGQTRVTFGTVRLGNN